MTLQVVPTVSADRLVQFPIDQVHRHANSVDQAAEAMQNARSAVHEISMDPQAYGQLCQFLPGLLTPVFEIGAATLRSSVEALRETADNLRDAAVSVHDTDVTNARKIDAAGKPSGTGLKLPL